MRLLRNTGHRSSLAQMSNTGACSDIIWEAAHSLVLHIFRRVRSDWSRLGEGLLGYTNSGQTNCGDEKNMLWIKIQLFSLNPGEKGRGEVGRKNCKLVLGCEWVDWFHNVNVYVENYKKAWHHWRTKISIIFTVEIVGSKIARCCKTDSVIVKWLCVFCQWQLRAGLLI